MEIGVSKFEVLLGKGGKTIGVSYQSRSKVAHVLSKRQTRNGEWVHVSMLESMPARRAVGEKE